MSLLNVLRVEGYAVQTAASFSEGLALLAHSPVDLVLLDLGLPDGDGDGESLLANLRRKHSTPVLVISAREQGGLKVQAAITRFEHSGLVVDLGAHRVSLGGIEQHLTPTEFKLLARLVRSAGQVVTHRSLLADVWGPEFAEHTHCLRLYMGQLRAKLEVDPADPQRLLTEPAVGYRLVD